MYSTVQLSDRQTDRQTEQREKKYLLKTVSSEKSAILFVAGATFQLFLLGHGKYRSSSNEERWGWVGFVVISEIVATARVVFPIQITNHTILSIFQLLE